MESAEIANDRRAAAACWVGAPLSGGLIPAILLYVTWQYRGSVTRRHALVATCVWAVVMAIYLPVFMIGVYLPALRNDPAWFDRSIWTLSLFVGFGVVSAIVGALVALQPFGRRAPAS